MAETIDAKVLDLMLNTEGVVREGDEGTLQVLPVAGIPYIKAQSLVALLHGVEINGHVMTKGSVAGQTTLSYQKLEKGKLKEPVHSLLRVGIAKTGTGFTSEYSYTTFVHPDHVMVSLPSTKVSPEHVADFLNKFAKGYAFDAFPRDQIDNESLCAELLRAMPKTVEEYKQKVLEAEAGGSIDVGDEEDDFEDVEEEDYIRIIVPHGATSPWDKLGHVRHDGTDWYSVQLLAKVARVRPDAAELTLKNRHRYFFEGNPGARVNVWRPDGDGIVEPVTYLRAGEHWRIFSNKGHYSFAEGEYGSLEEQLTKQKVKAKTVKREDKKLILSV